MESSLLLCFCLRLLRIMMSVQTNVRIITNLTCSLTSTIEKCFREYSIGFGLQHFTKNRGNFKTYFTICNFFSYSRLWGFFKREIQQSILHAFVIKIVKELNLRYSHVHWLMKLPRSHKLESSFLVESLDRLKGMLMRYLEDESTEEY